MFPFYVSKRHSQMPLISIKDVAKDVKLGIWKTIENVNEFFINDSDLLYLKPEICSYKAEQRRVEVLAVYSLLHRMGISERLLHNESGKPYLASGINISVSHTKGYAAVIVSGVSKVAVDIEYMSERVGNVAMKLLRHDEKADGLRKLMLHWCSKETLYKLHSEDHLALDDMRLLSISGHDDEGMVKIENVQRGETLDVCYRFFEGFVVTYAAV